MKSKFKYGVSVLAGLIASQVAVASGVAVTAPAGNLPDINLTIGGSASVTIGYTADATSTSYSGSFTYSDAEFNISGSANATAVCTAATEDGTGTKIYAFSDGDTNVLPTGAACTFTITHAGAAPGTFPYTIGCASEDIDTNATTCTPVSGNIVVLAGPQAGPAVTYTPAPNAAVGTITFPAATTIGGSTTFDILTAIGAGGANGGQTSVACTGSGNVTFTDGDVICTEGGTCDDTELVASCVSTNADQTGTVTCTETIDAETVAGDGNTTTATRTWGFTCPAANVNPTLSASVGTLSQVTQSQATGLVTVTPAGGSGTGSATYDTCTFAANTVSMAIGTPGLPLTFTGSSTTAQSFQVTCDPDAAADVTVAMTCSNDGTNEVLNVVCPQEVPRSAPAVTYSVAPAFNTGATVGATATSTANFTADLSGGLNDNAGGNEEADVACSITSGPFAIVGTASVNNVASPAAAGNDLDFGLTCTTPANIAAAGVLTCNYTATVDGTDAAPVASTFDLTCPPAPVNLASNPAPGPITLTGVPGSTLSGTIGFTNSGSDATLTCTATAGTANVAITSNPAAVAANGSAQLAYTCTAGSPGANLTGSIQCTSNDPDNFASVTYAITCAGLANAPIPAINDFGKVLMVVLVIGLGLVGLGARRQ